MIISPIVQFNTKTTQNQCCQETIFNGADNYSFYTHSEQNFKKNAVIPSQY